MLAKKVNSTILDQLYGHLWLHRRVELLSCNVLLSILELLPESYMLIQQRWYNLRLHSSNKLVLILFKWQAYWISFCFVVLENPTRCFCFEKEDKKRVRAAGNFIRRHWHRVDPATTAESFAPLFHVGLEEIIISGNMGPWMGASVNTSPLVRFSTTELIMLCI